MSETSAHTPTPTPGLLGLFQKRFEGDDALLALAGLRFRQAGLGTELYARTPEDLEWQWPYRPTPEGLATVHLDRNLNLLEERSHNLIEEFAARCRNRVFGMIVHDQRELQSQPEAYLAAVQRVAAALDKIEGAPRLYIEYAVGLEPAEFAAFFDRTRELESVSACIDVGHVGIREVRSTYSRKHPGDDVCGLRFDDPLVVPLADEIQEAVRSCLPVVLELIRTLARHRKPLHFHLHDGHPLSKYSPYSVSDHLSFLAQIPVPFEYDGRYSLPTLYGPEGLFQIVTTALAAIEPGSLSFNLEIHPTEGRLALRDAAHLFQHWQVRSNAERMNYWLSILAENRQLLTAGLRTNSSHGNSGGKLERFQS
jgi:hypothetical protein